MTLDVEDRLRRTLNDVGSRLEVGERRPEPCRVPLPSPAGRGDCRLRSPPWWFSWWVPPPHSPGWAAGPTTMPRSSPGPDPGVEASALLADHLLTTSQVEGVVDGLEEDEYQTGDHVLPATLDEHGDDVLREDESGA